MVRGATWSAAAMVGTPVFRIVVSSDSMKNATAINHGRSRLLESGSGDGGDAPSRGPGGITFVGLDCIGLRHRNHPSAFSRNTDYGRYGWRFHRGISR